MTNPATSTLDPKPTAMDSWRMFDRIAFRYDFLNRLLSFRRDIAWRKAMIRALPEGTGLRLLDLATGTGDVLLGLFRAGGKIGQGIGLDKSGNMLRFGREKVAREGAGSGLGLLRGDAALLGFRDASFDVATMAFGIRNVPDVPQALREIRRVLKPGGRALILEFSVPANAVFRGVYLIYFRHVLPRIGGWVSGDRQAYRYLNESVETFPHGDAFVAMMRDAGFRNTGAQPMTFGIATLYRGDA